MGLCTLNEVKAYLQVDQSDTDNDTILSALIDRASDLIEEYCNRKFESSSYTEYHDGGGNKIFLENYPVSSTETFQLWEDVDWEWNSDDLIDSDDYSIDYEKGIVFYDGVFAKGERVLKVSYTGGFSSIPESIKQACIELIAKTFSEGQQNSVGVTHRTLPDGTIGYSPMKALLPQIQLVLDLYRSPAI